MIARPAAERELVAVRQSLEGLDIDALNVAIVGDCVHIQGVALCYATKRLAAELAETAAPGACIMNELRVAQLPFAEDPEIARDLAATLDRIAPGAAQRIQLDVREGVVRLDGSAASAAERADVEHAAWAVRGVSHVQNALTVGHQASDGDLTTALNEYVQRAMNLRTITVQYRQGVVSLNGDVTSAAQREAIEDLVRWHDSVRDVVNDLQVAAIGRPAEGIRAS